MSDDVTLDAVAAAAGVSRSAASRALNGRTGVHREVRAKVQTVAADLGYRPNRSAQRLAGGRSSVIGLVLGECELRARDATVRLLETVARATEAHDLGLMLVMDSARPSVAVRNLVADGMIDGVIVRALAVDDQWVSEVLDAPLPSVLIGHHRERGEAHTVDSENVESTATLVGEMLDRGARRLGTITGPSERMDSRLRLDGIRLAHARRGIPFDESSCVEGSYSRISGYQAADRLIDAQVDAVFCANDEMAFGFAGRASEWGVRVPDDVMLAGFDGTGSAELEGLDLATVVQPFETVADRAVETLCGLIDGMDMPRERLIDPEIRFGSTLRRR